MLVERLLRVVDGRVGLVLRLDLSLAVGVRRCELSASLTILSMSASERPPEDWMRICCCLRRPCPWRHVDDAVGVDVEGNLDRGMPRGAAGCPPMVRPTAREVEAEVQACGEGCSEGGAKSHQVELSSILLSAAISRSPCSTLMPTCVWLSAAVEKVCDL